MDSYPIKKILRDLVAFKSYTVDECNRCIDYIHATLRERNIPCEILVNKGMKILVVTVGQGKRCLMLNAHIDVVQNDPAKFTLREEGDRLIGPGIFDMKASAAVFMEILGEIDFSRLTSRVMFQFVPDEEVGGEEGTGYLAGKGYTGDFLICCEPTNLKISVQSKGACFLTITVEGKASHGSRPWLGENAILKAVQLYQELQKLPYISQSSELFKCASVNLTKIEGGDSVNKTPDHCRMTLDVRYLPEQEGDEVMGQIQTVADRYGATLGEIRASDPIVTRLDNQDVQHLHRICRKQYPDCILFGQDGSSDARFYTPLGVPGIEFGPTGGGQHSAEEYIEFPKLLIYKDVLKEFIINFGRE
ncbi:MAG: M20/M25/M40 family metallo-hydrolase [Deltaproteobacteria bacterium]|nr:M20/M25/M40 family metallo-hydrolase [Deltaproteobacteria bacterium]MBI4374549.1 M20/M25/M40 family metallo-hydrolase [Deltaproteobacteria bacterium]